MKNLIYFNFDDCKISNELWPDFVNKIGFFKARLAIRQSLDLQNMQGNCNTVPVLILETCGSALVSSHAIKTYIGLCAESQGLILIYSSRLNSIQLLRDN